MSDERADLGAPDRAGYVAVVCYYRRGPRVVDTVDRLLRQTPPPEAIVLVDNGSQDGVIDALEQEGRLPGVTLLRTGANLGYAGAMNAGARAVAHVPHASVLFVTHELLLDDGCVAGLSAELARADVVAAGPALLLPDGDLWAVGGRLDWRGGARHHRDLSAGARATEWLDGACLLVNRASFDAVGGFDESYFLYWEDVDLSLRLRRRGELRVVPTARAVQEPSDGSGPGYYVARNRLWLWRRQRRRAYVLLGVAELLLWAVKRGLTQGPAAFVAVVRGCLDGLSRRPPARSPGS